MSKGMLAILADFEGFIKCEPMRLAENGEHDWFEEFVRQRREVINSEKARKSFDETIKDKQDE